MHLAQQTVLHRSVRYWRINGISYRVPTSDVSIVDLNVALKTEATYEDICKKMKEASIEELSGIIPETVAIELKKYLTMRDMDGKE